MKLVEDPYKQGEIACCNVLSDLYSMGVTSCDSILMILGVSIQMKEKEREIITSQIIKGFNDKATEAGTSITGGQSVMNPWPIIGGTAFSVLPRKDIIFPNNCRNGDVLVLTKPLGTQVAVNVAQWLMENNQKFIKYKEYLNEDEVWNAYSTAEKSMSKLNKKAAELMKNYRIGACTDVTGFGIKGHIENLAVAQKEGLNFYINALPVIKNMDIINNNVLNFKLLKGYSAETSGGLLICLSPNDADSYLKEYRKIDNDAWGWIIGEVTRGDRKVDILEKPMIIPV